MVVRSEPNRDVVFGFTDGAIGAFSGRSITVSFIVLVATGGGAGADEEGTSGRMMTDFAGFAGLSASTGTSNATRRSSRGELGRVEGAVEGGVGR